MKTFALILTLCGAAGMAMAQTSEMILSYGIVLEPGTTNDMCVHAYYDSDISDPDAQHLNSTINLLIPNGVNIVGINSKCGSWSLGGVTTTSAMDLLCGNGPFTHYQHQVVQDGPCTTGGTTVGVPQPLFTVTLDNACNETTLIRVLEGVETSFPEDECLNNLPSLNGNTGTLDNDGNGPNASNGGQSFIPPQPGENAMACPVVLPVQFISFYARPEGRRVLLQWHAITNEHTAVFVVERLADKEFAEIGRVSVGTGGNSQLYDYVDTQPLPGRSYYRIRQLDHDGSYIFSEIRSVTFLELASGIQLAPNPVRSSVSILCRDCLHTNARLVIVAPSGQIVREWNITDPRQAVPVDDLAAGIYIAQLYEGSLLIHTEKLVKLNE